VYSLLSMLGTHDKDDMSQTLLAMSNSQDSCVAMRQSGTDTVLCGTCWCNVVDICRTFWDISLISCSIPPLR